MLMFLKKIGIIPNKFKYFYKDLKYKEVKILDIGCGNNSAGIAKLYFPNCKYYGVDIVDNYKNDKDLKHLMEKFYLLNLETDNIDIITEKFDIINLSHVIEHLKNGDEVIKKLITKLNNGGYIYIEYPSTKSLSSPSMKNTLHFSDDETHKRLYDLKEIGNIFLNNNIQIIKGDYVRSKLKIFLFPVLYPLVKYFGFSTNYIWDYYKFAEFIIGKKK